MYILFAKFAPAHVFSFVQQAPQHFLQISDIRWLDSKPVAKRAIEVLDNVVQTVKKWEGLPKSQRPQCKSYSTVLESMQDCLVIAKLNFFLSLLT